MLRRAPVALLLVGVCAALAVSPAPRVGGEERAPDASSVAATNGVVVHGVDSKLLAARVREADRLLVAGDPEGAARELADLASADLSDLLEEGEGTYLSAQESVLQRVAELPEAGIAAYRRILDGRARAALDAAVALGDPAPLQREAFRLALTTDGPRMLVTLADLRLARGDAGGAARALEDVLRLWGEDAGGIPGVPRAAVVSRLATALAAQGDSPGIRALAASCSEALRGAQSAAFRQATVAEELDRAARGAERFAREALRDRAAGPAGPCRLVAERLVVDPRRERGPPTEPRDPDRIRERPIAVGSADRPALLVRVVNAPRTKAVVEAVALRPGDAGAAGTLETLWTWPSSSVEESRPPGDAAFAPARLTDDLVAFAWPAPADETAASGGRFADAGEARYGLVVLSLRGEGRLVDERGRFEVRRPDGDPVLETLSFQGRPAVEGGALYATLVRHAPGGEATELHVARFDVADAGADVQLRLRWRRHLVDGNPMPPALYPAHMSDELMLGAAAPSGPLVRNGRVFVASNTGAVACLDAATGRAEWVETYERFGPSMRTTVREALPSTWGDVPLAADGPFVFAAPRDAEAVLQMRRAPLRARSVRVETFALSAPSGTARRASRLLPDVVPNEVVGVLDGLVVLSGRVARRPLGSLRVEGSPLAGFSATTRRAVLAQVQEAGSAGTPCFAGDAVLFPTSKSIYRVPLADFEGAPVVLWTAPAAGDAPRAPDRIGNLVPDGKRLWSVTPSRVCLFE